MPNIASVLKDEISRVARKEVKAATRSLKTQSSQHRRQIAGLKRQVLALEKALRKHSKIGKASVPLEAEPPSTGLRFRPQGLAAHRKRLGLSAAQAGALLGVSGQSIYHWEAGKTRPRAAQMPAISALRKLNKGTAAAALAQVLSR
jgi:DNA-binding transcriptional regulator YiaG